MNVCEWMHMMSNLLHSLQHGAGLIQENDPPTGNEGCEIVYISLIMGMVLFTSYTVQHYRERWLNSDTTETKK